MDLRLAIRNLISSVAIFVTEPKLKSKLQKLLTLTKKCDSNLEDIKSLMISLGEDKIHHYKKDSETLELSSPQYSGKVATSSGANLPAFLGGLISKPLGSESRIQYITYVKNEGKIQSDGNIPLSSLSTRNQKEIKFFEKSPLINAKTFIEQLNISPRKSPVPQTKYEKINEEVIKEFNNSKNQLNLSNTQHQLIQSFNIEKIKQVQEECIKEFKQNTSKLISILEYTNDINTGNSLKKSSSLDISSVSIRNKNNNPMFKNIYISEKEFNKIQDNFLWKKKIIRAKLE